MTAQSTETIYYKGEGYGMASEPLKQYLDSMQNPPFIRGLRSDCWRGYFGQWEVVDDMLFLIHLELYSWEHQGDGLKFLFPGEDKVFANWYNGVVRLPHGKMLDYVHGGYGSTFQFDFFLTFESGRLIQERWVKNKPPEKTHMQRWIEQNTPDDPVKTKERLDRIKARTNKIERLYNSKKDGTEDG